MHLGAHVASLTTRTCALRPLCFSCLLASCREFRNAPPFRCALCTISHHRTRVRSHVGNLSQPPSRTPSAGATFRTDTMRSKCRPNRYYVIPMCRYSIHMYHPIFLCRVHMHHSLFAPRFNFCPPIFVPVSSCPLIFVFARVCTGAARATLRRLPPPPLTSSCRLLLL